MLQKLATFILKVTGWTAVGEVPPLDKAVFVAASHTSNWDAFWLLIYKIAIDEEVTFFAKHTLFWWPLGNILGAFGAIPVNRSERHATVKQLVDLFAEKDHLFLAMAPEGTRKWKPYWKSGFYQIARAARVPIVLAFIDYPSKRMGIGIQLMAEDPVRDMEIIREFYEPFVPAHPKLKSPVALSPDAFD